MKAAIFDYNRTLFNPDSNNLFPEVTGILEALKKKVKLALVAKGDADRMKQIEQLGLLNYFEVVAINQQKDLADYQSCLEKLGVRAEDAYVIGDRVSEEIRIGNLLGAVTIWFRNGKFRDELPKSKNELPAYTIEDLNSLLKVLKA